MDTETLDHHQSRAEPKMFAATPRQKPDGKFDPAGEVGWFLQREREKRGIDLQDAADVTGIHPYHLEAIEMGDMTHMPPRLEAMEMMAVYAQLLGFDPDPLVQHLASFMPAPPVARKNFHPANPPVLSSAKILRFGQLPKVPSLNIKLSNYPGGTGGIVASVFAAFMVFAATSWLMSSPNGADEPSQQVAQVAPAVQPPAVDPMPTASTGAETAQVNVTEQPILGVSAVASSKDVPAIPAAEETASTAPEDPDAMGAFIQEQIPAPNGATKAKPVKIATADIKQSGEARVFGADNNDARIVLKAKAPVWLRIEDDKGNVLITQMLAAGDTYRVPNRDGLIALSRDGGKLSYLIDGQEKGVLGAPGKILVGEKLDVAALEAKK